MILGIDASNIRGGGGVTHLTEMLFAARPHEFGFERVVVFAGSDALRALTELPWVRLEIDQRLDRNLAFRIFWQRVLLRRLAARARCDLLFVPGGLDASGFRPMITMSRNMLPFESGEASRYGLSFGRVRLKLLKYGQGRTFRRADGVIFLTNYARNAVSASIGRRPARDTIVPHGLHPRFLIPPRLQRPPDAFTQENPCRVIYVSNVDVYKHQWHVVDAVARLCTTGHHVTLDLVGAPGPGRKRLASAICRATTSGAKIKLWGAIPHGRLHEFYSKADIGVYASSCENMPNILLESMGAGLPLACSNRGPMPEILGDGGVYFDPEFPDQIASAICKLIENPELRARKAEEAHTRAGTYSWGRCADETFRYLQKAATDLAILR